MQFVDRLGARVRACRLQRGWSQAELALLVQWSPAEVALVERARTVMSLRKVYKLAQAFEVSPAYFLDEAPAPLPQMRPPTPADPNYVVDPKERRLLHHWRELVPREKRIVMHLASGIPTCRDQRYDPIARKLAARWSNPDPTKAQDPLSPKITPGMGLWLRENADRYHGKWIAMKLGKFQAEALTRPELIQKLVGIRDLVLINLLDIDRPKMEKWSWEPTPQPQPPTQPLPPRERPQEGSAGSGSLPPGDAE